MVSTQTRSWPMVLAILSALMLALFASTSIASADGVVEWEGNGVTGGELDHVQCNPQDPDAPAGSYLHWIFTGNAADSATLYINGGLATGVGGWANGLMTRQSGGAFHYYSAWYDLALLEAYVDYDGDLGPGNAVLTISHGCPPGGEITVSKTAQTAFTRTHDWDVEKSATPDELWLYTDGSGDATVTWEIIAKYLGYEDTGFSVSGTITVENTGGLDATVNSVTDLLAAGVVADVTCDETLPYLLVPGDTLECTYSKSLDAPFDGTNTATAAGTFEDTTPFSEDATAAFAFGDPTTELYKVVDVIDISDLLGTVNLGTLDADDFDVNETQKFSYTHDFAYEDYEECGDFSYDNTAKIVSGETVIDEDSATVDVHVQCLIFQGETAWAANGNVPGQLPYNTRRGNWATYVQYASKTTTLFAGQTIDVGDVTFSAAVAGQVTITVTLDGDWEFADAVNNLKVQGYSTPPSGNPSPGLFAYKTTCDPDLSTCSITVPLANYYGVHVDVGQWTPDPNFGP